MLARASLAEEGREAVVVVRGRALHEAAIGLGRRQHACTGVRHVDLEPRTTGPVAPAAASVSDDSR